MIRRENGVKYLDVDGAKCVVHMCSTAENYFDRYAFDAQPSSELIAEFIERSKYAGVFMPGQERQECCHCGHVNETYALFPNNAVNICCTNCKQVMSLYVIQISRDLEAVLGLEGPTTGIGTGTIWLSVPWRHPEFLRLITRTGYSHGAKIRCLERSGGAPWWRHYHLFLSSINKKA